MLQCFLTLYGIYRCRMLLKLNQYFQIIARGKSRDGVGAMLIITLN